MNKVIWRVKTGNKEAELDMAKTKTSWKKGISGNPAGRPRGISKIALVRQMLDPFADDLIMRAKEMALDGDTTALKLCLERIVPPIKMQDECIYLPNLLSTQALSEQADVILEAVSLGEITPGQSSILIQSLTNRARIQEHEELDERLKALEEYLHVQ